MAGGRNLDPASASEDPARILEVLRASEARYRALVLASSQLVWRTDPHGEVVENTDAWEKTTGQPHERSSGWGWLDVVHPDDRPGTVEEWTRCLRHGVPYEREYRIAVEGGWRWVLARAVPVRTDDGEIREWIGTSIDVDEAHRGSEQREALLADLQDAVARTALLQRVTADLAATQSVPEVAAVVQRHLHGSLGARTGSMYLPDASGLLRMVVSFGYPAWVRDGYGTVDPAADLPVAAAFRAGESLFLSREEVAARAEELDPVLAATGNTAVAALPLVAGARVIGALTVGFADEGSFTPATNDLLVALTTQAAQALDRASVVGRLREVAADLQQGLAPGAVPDVPGLDVAAVYRPGGHAVELVGGDWYDVLPLPGGHVAVVVGDVMGRGVHAATTMASVSAAVRAYALLDPEPATLLACLDEFVATHAPQQFVTLFYGLLDTGSGRLRFVLAGHLPPLLVLDGDPLVHPGEAGPPLGLPGVRPVHECLLGCGHGIVVVTDGVVERRDRSIDDGFELARRAAAGHERSVDVAAAVAGVAGQAGADGADDVTVVALRREPAGRDGRAPATRP